MSDFSLIKVECYSKCRCNVSVRIQGEYVEPAKIPKRVLWSL